MYIYIYIYIYILEALEPMEALEPNQPEPANRNQRPSAAPSHGRRLDQRTADALASDGRPVRDDNGASQETNQNQNQNQHEQEPAKQYRTIVAYICFPLSNRIRESMVEQGEALERGKGRTRTVVTVAVHLHCEKLNPPLCQFSSPGARQNFHRVG